MALLADVDLVIAAKGRKVRRLEMGDADEDAIADAILGPTGNLRAPAFRRGRTMVVGFEDGAYREVLS